MSESSERYNRSTQKHGGKSANVDKEVQRLLKDNPHQISQSTMYKLREKYNDEGTIN